MTDESREAKYEDALVIDPGDYYGLPLQAQAVYDALLEAMELERDYVTMIAIRKGSIGVWHHTPTESVEYLREWTSTGQIETKLGSMNRGDV